VCRHRGTVLKDEGAGNTKGAFVCPYHNWTYDLEGALVGTPNVRADEDFDRSAYPLRHIACDEWDGFVFVHLGSNPQPLLDQLAEEPDGPLEYERYRVGELRTAHRIVYEVAANWKLIHDNYNECLPERASGAVEHRADVPQRDGLRSGAAGPRRDAR
jgi:Rieske 2Fe-2S family protein